jgi:uncharacterized membrane protein
MAVAETLDVEDTAARRVLLERMLFFSDAVFAIVLTLLALSLSLPAVVDDAHLLTALYLIRGQLIAFALSFSIVGVFWVAHLTMMRALARFDWVLAGVNLVFLFTITTTPFASSLVGRFGVAGNAWRLYCLTIVAISLAQAALLIVSHRDEGRLVYEEHRSRLWFRLARAVSPGVAFAIGLALSLAGRVVPASLCWVLIPVLMLTAGQIERSWPKPSKPPAQPPSEAAEA